MFFRLLKRFFLIFGSALDRTLDDLDTIKNRCHRIQKQYQEARVKLISTRQEVESKAEYYKQLVINKEAEITKATKAMLNADQLKDTESVEIINNQIEAYEDNLLVLKETLQIFLDQIVDLDEEQQQLDYEINESQNILTLAQTRYEAAKALVDLNTNGIPDSLRSQIDAVRKESDEMVARSKGVKNVKNKLKPKADAVIRQHTSAKKTAAERLAEIRKES